MEISTFGDCTKKKNGTCTKFGNKVRRKSRLISRAIPLLNFNNSRCSPVVKNSRTTGRDCREFVISVLRFSLFFFRFCTFFRERNLHENRNEKKGCCVCIALGKTFAERFCAHSSLLLSPRARKRLREKTPRLGKFLCARDRANWAKLDEKIRHSLRIVRSPCSCQGSQKNRAIVTHP